MKILVVEDDKRIADPIAEDLRRQHYVVDVVDNGETALSATQSVDYDLLLIDVMLPRVDGLQVCRTLRSRGYTGGILMLTARSAKRDKVLGLDSGADDYVVKPFDLDELNARVRSLLRRSADYMPTELAFADLAVNLRSCSVRYRDLKITLSPTEYRLLVTFLKNPGRVFTKNELLDKLWDSDNPPTYAVVKAHIKGLRQKLAAAGVAKTMIETVYGFGYRLNADAG